MKKHITVLTVFSIVLAGCTSSNKFVKSDDKTLVANDTIRIANDELEYEVIIIDGGFNSWFAAYARPRSYYSQQYLEARNRIWVQEWNARARQPETYNSSLFEMQIDYQNNIDYGYEVNYMLYNYLTYFQLTNNIKLGGFAARL